MTYSQEIEKLEIEEAIAEAAIADHSYLLELDFSEAVAEYHEATLVLTLEDKVEYAKAVVMGYSFS